ACKKSSVDAPGLPLPTAGVSKIKTRAVGVNIINYTYDALGRIVAQVNSNGSKQEFEYLTGVVNKKFYNTSGVFQYGYKFELNAEGLCIRTTMSNSPNYELLHLFNPDKTVAKEISHINGNNSGRDYFYSNGNLDSIRFTGNNGNWQLTISKTYYTDKPNVLSVENYGELFYGKDNKNMIKSEVYKYPDGSTTSESGYSYEYDAQGRVIKQTSTAGNNIEIQLYTYY
ncbi:MAG TPA: hypothetical protein VN451_07920, partial [Chitinophagaceae bacterium]|nr:hypothetical protein [Chitinophagaceae bacterium]